MGRRQGRKADIQRGGRDHPGNIMIASKVRCINLLMPEVHIQRTYQPACKGDCGSMCGLVIREFFNWSF